MAISFFFQDTKVTLRDRKRLKLFIASLFRSHGKTLGSLIYIFCTDKFLLDMNQQFLNHDYYTDIITFDLSTFPHIVDAEVYISVERVKENAGAFGISIKEELHRVIFHGALHLCGYGDKRSKDKEIMSLEEDKNLRFYFA